MFRLAYGVAHSARAPGQRIAGGANRDLAVASGRDGPGIVGAWTKVAVPKRFANGIDGIARIAAWRVRGKAEGGVASVEVEERYRRLAPQVVSLVALVDAQGDEQPGLRSLPNWGGLEGRLPQAVIEREIRRLLASSDDPASFWSGWRLLVTAAPDEVVPDNLLTLHQQVIESAPGASLWSVQVSKALAGRLAAMRAFFAVEHAPEIIDRAPNEFDGFVSARGLFADGMGVGVETLIEIFCAWQSPWLMGVCSSRGLSPIVTLSARLWDGITADPSELLQLFSSSLLVKQTRNGLPRPELTDGAIEGAFRWWVGQINLLLFHLTDLANFRRPDGTYDVAAHVATVLSIERLAASTLTSLTAGARSKYVRRLMLFDVLEILDGLGVANVGQLADFNDVQKQLDALEGRLPDSARDVFLPRCRRAVEGLEATAGGFLDERRSGGRVQSVDKRGNKVELNDARAVSQLIRGVRNTTHSFRRAMRDERFLSLLASHDGELPDEFSDLAAFHLLRLIADPALLFRSGVS